MDTEQPPSPPQKPVPPPGRGVALGFLLSALVIFGFVSRVALPLWLLIPLQLFGLFLLIVAIVVGCCAMCKD